MKTILCYGDSNTWGEPPGGSGRYPWDVRWPGVLQRLLGNSYHVVEEGLQGRTTCYDDPDVPNRSGLGYMPVCLESHAPLDLLVLMLGSNDVRDQFNLSPVEIANGIQELVYSVSASGLGVKDILIVSPPHIVQSQNAEIAAMFATGIYKSKQLARLFEQVASDHGCHFYDAQSVAHSSPIDGIHLDQANHTALANGLFTVIKSIYSDQTSGKPLLRG